MKLISLIFIISFSFQAFASTEFAGNGGHVVLCPKGSPFEIKLLDVYEEERFNPKFQFDLGPSSLSLKEKIKFNLKKLKNLSPHRYRTYEKDLEEFFEKRFWVSSEELVEIPDTSLHATLPKNCKIAQMAVQLKKENRHGYRYLVVKSFWDLLPLEERVALVFHEIIYKEAIKLGADNSVEARQLNTWILGKSFQDVDRHEFKTYLGKTIFPPETIHGVYPGHYEYTSYFSSGNLMLAIVGEKSKLYLGSHYLELPKSTQIYFLDNPKNSIDRVVHHKINPGKVSGHVQMNGKKIKIKDLNQGAMNGKPFWFDMILNEENEIVRIQSQQELY